MTLNKFWLTLFLISLSSLPLSAQEELSEKQQKEADRLLLEYRFSEALPIYRNLLQNDPDSSALEQLQQKVLWCENGLSYLQFAADPTPINQQLVGKKDFFRYFGQRNWTWVATPNAFAPNAHPDYCPGILYNPAAQRIYFSAQDESGSWNIYSSERQNAQ